MTDPHVKGGNPSTRTDEFPETIFAKIEEWLQNGIKEEVDFFVCGGDIVDSPYTSNRVIERLGRLFNKYLQPNNKELFIVWGNHDVFGWNPNTAIDTSLGLLQRFSSNIIVMNRETTLRDYNGVRVSLTGVSSYARLDKDTPERHRSEDYIVDKKVADVDIHVVHGYLSMRELLDDIPHTLVSDISSTKANFTLTGHEHTGFPPMYFDNERVVCNPGALGRVFASKTEINRMPQYLMCNWEDGKVNIAAIQSPIALKGEEVMDRSTIDKKAIRERILEEAQGDIREVLQKVNVETVDLNTVMRSFKGKVEERFYEEAIRRLEKEID